MTSFLKTADIPLHGATTLPRRFYTSQEIFEAERERIFLRRWLCLGRADQIANAGDYFLQGLGDESVIVLRDRGGKVRAFHNVCRHRGTRLCEEERGRLAGTIQCPYHAWTYSLDGRLIGAPSLSDVDEFDKSAYPLHPVALEEWEGFLFINFARHPQPFAEAFAPFIGKFAGYNLPELRPAQRIDYDVRANWKLLFQNYSECYHCSPVHPALVKLTPAQSGENDLFDGPFLGGFMVITQPGGSLSLSGRACGLPVGDIPAEDLNRVYYYSVFPNMLLSLHPDYVMFHTLWPQDPRRTLIMCEWLFHPDSFGRTDLDPQDGVAFWDKTNREDWHICEQSQLGVASRAYVPGPYSHRETLSAAFDREVLRALEE